MQDPITEKANFIMLEAKYARDDPVLLGYLLKKLKDTYVKEDEKMPDNIKQFIQKEADHLMKTVPELIHKKKLELKNQK